MAEQNEDRIVRNEELQKMLGIGRTSIWRMEKDGELPPRVKIGSHAVGWRLSDIRAFIANAPTADKV